MPLFSEQQIAAGLQAGRQEAWLQLYDTYAARLWRHVARIGGGDASDVADVVQATLLAAAGSARGFDPSRGSLWSWLCGIARNQAALSKRQNKSLNALNPDARQDSGETAWAAWLAGEIDEPPSRLQSKETAEIVRQALARLPEDYQLLLLSRYVDGNSAEEIALAAGTTGQAVRSKLARARQALQDRLARLAPSMIAEDGVKQ
ncbi:MAG TPA: sigma-70 family RNA polymerase sigma factor [Humisphaera sp.]|jgi:RNA polymerase sigma-70 factor (ECF subfamily)|nr:sigma-70 family RNA polymerase sigma factor [Humisphaera sp.]